MEAFAWHHVAGLSEGAEPGAAAAASASCVQKDVLREGVRLGVCEDATWPPGHHLAEALLCLRPLTVLLTWRVRPHFWKPRRSPGPQGHPHQPAPPAPDGGALCDALVAPASGTGVLLLVCGLFFEECCLFIALFNYNRNACFL